jgi:ribose transport system permease protein
MKKLTISPPVAAVLLAIVLFFFSGFLPNSFGADLNAAAGQAVNIIRLSVFLGIIAAGQTLVIISGSEGIDLSAGSVVTLSAILTWTIVQGQNGRVIPALIAVLLVGALIGLINGAGIIFLKISRWIVIIANHGNAQGMLAPIMTRVIGRPLIFGIPGAIIIYAFFAGLMWLILERSTFGKNLFAIGVNRITTRLSGVNVTGMVLMTYALAGALAAFGGFMVVGNTGVVFLNLGAPFLFPSIAAVAVGGTLLSGGKGSYFGTMAGALVLILITSLLTTMQMKDAVRQMVMGATLLC